ncbi:MAG: hypothetical protein JRF28_08685, partial [Deltaproteobacteria bacterium]|nr:hypothetical protein [Deltaproteobacteria bacterium]
IDVDLDPDDLADVTESAIGLGGYATDGKWVIQFVVGKLELEEGASTGKGGATLTAKVGFDVTGAELTVGYPVYEIPALTLRAYTGARYTKHELDLSLTATGPLNGLSKSIDESWTDVLIGPGQVPSLVNSWL